MCEIKLTKRSTADRLRYIVDHVSNFEVTMPFVLREIADEIDTLQARSAALVVVVKATGNPHTLYDAIEEARALLTDEEKES